MDNVSIKPYIVFHFTDAYLRVDELLMAENYRYLQSIQGSVIDAVRRRMREWHGDEKRNVRAAIAPGSVARLLVFGDLPQTFVDEWGRKPGSKYPPYGPESNLRKWVREELHPTPKAVKRPRVEQSRRIENAEASVSFLVARAIHARGIPARSPFAKAFAERAPFVMAGLREVGATVARKANGMA